MLTLGASPAIPGIVIPSYETEEMENHELLKTLQTNAAKPPIEMSRHRAPDTTYFPNYVKDATHVYVQLDKPNNLGQKYLGPFPIVGKPSPSTITVMVGHTVQGLPRLEVHSWDRCKIAKLREGQQDASRPKLGRRTLRTSGQPDNPANTDQNKQTSQDEQLTITQPQYQLAADTQEIFPPTTQDAFWCKQRETTTTSQNVATKSDA